MVREDNFAVAVIAENRPGVIRSVTNLLEGQDYFLHGVRVRIREGDYHYSKESVLEIEIEFSSKEKIDRASVMESMRGIEGVLKAEALN